MGGRDSGGQCLMRQPLGLSLHGALSQKGGSSISFLAVAWQVSGEMPLDSFKSLSRDSTNY